MCQEVGVVYVSRSVSGLCVKKCEWLMCKEV